MKHKKKLWRRCVPAFGLVVLGATASAIARPSGPEAQGAPQAPKATLAIVGGMLIDGRGGDPIQRSVVLIDGQKIVAVGTVDSLKVPVGTRVIDAGGQTVMGGLTEAHAHLDFLGHALYVEWHKAYSAMGAVGERIAAISARQLLNAGVTTAVDLGGAPETQIHTRDKINRGELVGPRMKVSAGWLWNTTPEAEGENHRGMEGYLHPFNVHTPKEARAAVLKQIALGADIIKSYGSLTTEQTKVVVEEAHKKGIKVTGHGGAADYLLQKILNGQDAIEHGVNADNPELLKQLVAHRTWVVPTFQGHIGPEAYHWPMLVDNPRFRALTPPDLYESVRNTLLHPEKVAYFNRRGDDPSVAMDLEKITPTLKNTKKLYDVGVRLLVGDDSGTPLNYHTDSTRRQMGLLVRAGIPPMRVLTMATKYAAEYLGMSSTLGTIEPGKFADIIVVDGNPLVDMGALQYVAVVVKEGVQYKGAGTPPAVLKVWNNIK